MKFKIEMVVPERIFFEGEIDSLIVETTDGYMGILAGHAPMVIGLIPSAIVFKIDGEKKIAASGEGFITVHGEKTIILSQTMEWPEDIDPKRVSREIEEGKRRMRDAKNELDFNLGKSIFERGNARLKVLQMTK